jgi:hypothetical protein
MTIDEKYDNAIQMLHGYYDGKNERLRIASSVLKENGFNTDFHGEFVSMICGRLGREGILKESPFTFLPSDKGIIDQVRYQQLNRKMEEMPVLSYAELGRIQEEIFSMDRILTFVVDGGKLDAVYNNSDRNPKNELAEKTITFNDESARILIGEIPLQLPPFQNEHCLCRVIFKRKIHEPVDWSLVYKEMTGDIEEIADKKKMRAVQDAMYALNNRVKKEANTDDSLFSWEGKSMARNF